MNFEKKVNCILLYGFHQRPMHKYAGPFRIATELRNKGYTVQCIDISSFSKLDENFLKILSCFIDKNTLWLGFSTTFFSSINKLDFENLIQFAKNINPNLEIIGGGSRVDLLTDLEIKLFLGYSDTEIIEFTDWCAKKNKNLKFNFKLINGSEYNDFCNSQIIYDPSDFILSSDVLPIEISRGCIFKCKFCSYELNGKTKGEWIKNPKVLIDEFNRNYNDWGVTNYIFSDDTYNDSLEKIKKMYYEVFEKLTFKIKFSAYLRLDLIMRFPEMAHFLKESGLENAIFGIETINFESAKSIGKGVNPELQFNFIKELKEKEFKNINIHSGFILGLPYDTEATCVDTKNFLLSDANPLDSFSIQRLGLNIKDNNPLRTNYSEFELNYEKYGYIVDKDGNWVNKKTNLNSNTAGHYSSIIMNEAFKKFKVPGFMHSYYKIFNIPDQDLKIMSHSQLKNFYKIELLQYKKKEEYKKQLKKFVNLN